MKKILILSYHFEPMNVIASQRALGFANHFYKFGFEPTILTHQWNKNIEEQYCDKKEIVQKTIFEKNEKYSIYKMPIGRFNRGKLLKRIENSVFNKIGILISWLFGHLDTKGDLLNCYLSERVFLENHLKSHQYDVVIGVFSPHYHHKNCNWVYDNYKIPFILDYRDLWSNRIIHKYYRPNYTEKIQDYFSKNWWKKWSKNALFNSITSEPWSKKLNQTVNKNCYVITNGFESSFFEKKDTFQNTEIFKIVHNGSLYSHQNQDIFFEGVKIFLEKVKPAFFKIEFVGSKRFSYSKGINSFIDPIEIQHGIEGNYISFSERIPYCDSINNIFTAQVLYFPTFPYSKGTYAGKIFEYLAAHKNILAVPKDNDVIDKLLLETNAGVSIDSANEVASYIEMKYNEWIKNGFCEFNGFEDEINRYSRESQTEKLSILIEEVLR